MAIIPDSNQTVEPKLVFETQSPLEGYIPDQHQNDNFIQRNALNAEKFNEYERLLNELSLIIGDANTGLNNKTLGENIRLIITQLQDFGLSSSSGEINPYHMWLLGGTVFNDPSRTVSYNTDEGVANSFEIVPQASAIGDLKFDVKGGAGIVGNTKTNIDIVEFSNPILDKEFDFVETFTVGDNVVLSNDTSAALLWTGGEQYINLQVSGEVYLEHRYLKGNVFTGSGFGGKTLVGVNGGSAYGEDPSSFSIDKDIGKVTMHVSWPGITKFYYVYHGYRKDLVILQHSDGITPSTKIDILKGTSASKLSDCVLPSVNLAIQRPLYEAHIFPWNNNVDTDYAQSALFTVDQNVIDLRIDVTDSNDKFKFFKNGVLKAPTNPLVIDIVPETYETMDVTLNPHVVNIDGVTVVTKAFSETLLSENSFRNRWAAFISDKNGNITLLHGSPEYTPILSSLPDNSAYVGFVLIKGGTTNAVLNDSIFYYNNPIYQEIFVGDSYQDGYAAYAFYNANLITQFKINKDNLINLDEFILEKEIQGYIGNAYDTLDILNLQRVKNVRNFYGIGFYPRNIKYITADSYINNIGTLTIQSTVMLKINDDAIFSGTTNFIFEDYSKCISETSTIDQITSLSIGDYCDIDLSKTNISNIISCTTATNSNIKLQSEMISGVIFGNNCTAELIINDTISQSIYGNECNILLETGNTDIITFGEKCKAEININNTLSNYIGINKENNININATYISGQISANLASGSIINISDSIFDNYMNVDDNCSVNFKNTTLANGTATVVLGHKSQIEFKDSIISGLSINLGNNSHIKLDNVELWNELMVPENTTIEYNNLTVNENIIIIGDNAEIMKSNNESLITFNANKSISIKDDSDFKIKNYSGNKAYLRIADSLSIEPGQEITLFSPSGTIINSKYDVVEAAFEFPTYTEGYTSGIILDNWDNFDNITPTVYNGISGIVLAENLCDTVGFDYEDQKYVTVIYRSDAESSVVSGNIKIGYSLYQYDNVTDELNKKYTNDVGIITDALNSITKIKCTVSANYIHVFYFCQTGPTYGNLYHQFISKSDIVSNENLINTLTRSTIAIDGGLNWNWIQSSPYDDIRVNGLNSTGSVLELFTVNASGYTNNPYTWNIDNVDFDGNTPFADDIHVTSIWDYNSAEYFVAWRKDDYSIWTNSFNGSTWGTAAVLDDCQPGSNPSATVTEPETGFATFLTNGFGEKMKFFYSNSTYNIRFSYFAKSFYQVYITGNFHGGTRTLDYPKFLGSYAGNYNADSISNISTAAGNNFIFHIGSRYYSPFPPAYTQLIRFIFGNTVNNGEIYQEKIIYSDVALIVNPDGSNVGFIPPSANVLKVCLITDTCVFFHIRNISGSEINSIARFKYLPYITLDQDIPEYESALSDLTISKNAISNVKLDLNIAANNTLTTNPVYIGNSINNKLTLNADSCSGVILIDANNKTINADVDVNIDNTNIFDYNINQLIHSKLTGKLINNGTKNVNDSTNIIGIVSLDGIPNYIVGGLDE